MSEADDDSPEPISHAPSTAFGGPPPCAGIPPVHPDRWSLEARSARSGEDLAPATAFGGPPPLRMRGRKRGPRWTIAFLRALERCGQARAAAEDAGIDHTTAYARRRTHPEFAEAWAAALAAHRERREEGRGFEPGQVACPPPLPVPLPLTGARENGCGEELLVASGTMRRAGPGRWSKGRERLFLETLTCEANVRRAAAAAGISTQALYRRRLKDRHFAAAWDAAVETGKARLHALLLAQAERTFDPDALPVGENEPRISAGDAIRLLSIGRGGKPRPEGASARGWTDWEEGEPDDGEYEARVERIIGRLRRLHEREKDEKLAAGWSLDEEHDRLIPPGWVRG